MSLFKKITSLQNIRIKEVAKLRQRKFRDISSLTIVEGVREISQALKANIRIQEFYFCKDCISGKENDALIRNISSCCKAVFEVSDKVFKKIAFGDRLEGCLAVVRPSVYSLDNLKLGKNPFLVVVEKVEKPGNIGAILRTCDAAGVTGLIICDAATDIYNPNVIRASLGAVFSVKVVQGLNQEVFKFLKRNNISTYATTPYSSSLYADVDFTKPSAIILGSEQDGLTDFWLENSDEKITIPMKGKVDSLNVSASAAVTVFEVVRQRSFLK